MEAKPEPSKRNRLLRRGLIALAWFVSIIALYYGIADWRGGHVWNEYRQNYEARVASLDFQTYIPKEIPDSENFAATPFALSWIKQWRDTISLYARDAYRHASELVDDSQRKPAGRRFEDLAAWQEAFAAVDSHAAKPKDKFRTVKLDLASRAQAAPAVLDAMKDDESAIDELRAASARPGVRYPVVYDMENPWGILLPHLAKIKQTCQRLKLMTCAELASGQSQSALDDTRLAFYMADTAKSEPFLISYLVRLACVQIAVQPIWEGLAGHRWTGAQLQQLQTRLEACDFLADVQAPMNAERAGGVLTSDLLKKKGLGVLADFGEISEGSSSAWSQNKPLLDLLGRIIPSGWYDQEKLHYCMKYDGEFHGVVDDVSRRIIPAQLAANISAHGIRVPSTEGLFLSHGSMSDILHHDLIAAMLLPALSRIPVKTAAAQTAADQAAVACALERYRLADGQFPENLQALVPRFATHLPNDVITGESFKYRRTDDGRFILYSVGWNEKDDGGIPGKTMFDDTEGDWVWEYPGEK